MPSVVQSSSPREINFTPTSNVGVTLAWRVLIKHQAYKLIQNTQTTPFGSKLTAES